MVRNTSKRSSAPPPPPPARHSMLSSGAVDAGVTTSVEPEQTAARTSLSETERSVNGAITSNEHQEKRATIEQAVAHESAAAPGSSPASTTNTSLLKIVKKNMTSQSEHKSTANTPQHGVTAHTKDVTALTHDVTVHAQDDHSDKASSANRHNASQNTGTSPDKTTMCHQCQNAINPNDIKVKDGVGRKLVEKVRNFSQLSYGKSQQVVELILRSLGNDIPEIAVVMDSLLLNVHYQVCELLTKYSIAVPCTSE